MRHTHQPRHAFTLIEMIVVLAIMGIALAVVGPALIFPENRSSLEQVMSDSRTAAIRRSEQVTLSVEKNGSWRMYVSRSAANVLRSGQLNENIPGPVAIEISPLGLCTLEAEKSVPAVTLDPFSCTLALPTVLRR